MNYILNALVTNQSYEYQNERVIYYPFHGASSVFYCNHLIATVNKNEKVVTLPEFTKISKESKNIINKILMIFCAVKLFKKKSEYFIVKPEEEDLKINGRISIPFHQTKIISAFPGMGKSFYHGQNLNCLDSDSSKFSWNDNKTRNQEFPGNYIKHIKESLGKCDYIFVSSHKEVREVLEKENLFHYLIYPTLERKQEFIERYRARGNDDAFIALVESNWDSWIKDVKFNPAKCKFISMSTGNLSDAMISIAND